MFTALENMEPGQVIKKDPTSNFSDMNLDDIPKDLFSMEIQTCAIAEKGMEIHIVKVNNVLSFWCICLKCGQRCADESALKLHMHIHFHSEGYHSYPASSRPALTSDTPGITIPESTQNGSPTSREIIHDNIGLSEYNVGNEYLAYEHDRCIVGAQISTFGVGADMSTGTVGADAENSTVKTSGTSIIGADSIKVSESGISGEPYDSVRAANQTGADIRDGVDDGADKSSNFGVVICNELTEQKPYLCLVCGQAFKRKTLLETHYRNHGKEDVYKCEDCNKRFTSAEGLSVHRRMHTNEKPYVCKVCGHRFKRRSNLKVHISRKNCEANNQSNNKPTIQAEQKGPVDWQQNQDQQLINRQAVPYGERKPMECNICGLKLLRPQRYIEHMYVHTGERPYKCTECGQAFKKRSLLNMHTRKHKGEDVYKCRECDKQFASAAGLKYHTMIHSGEKPYVCKGCGQGFKKNLNLDNHIRKQKCGQRGQAPQTVEQLLISRQAVPYGKRKPIDCSICGLKLYRPQRYIEHMNVHTGEKPYKCSDCGRAFRVKAIFNLHCRKHRDKDVLRCQDCQKQFSTLDGLKVHRRIHTDEKPYVCKECGHGFRRKSDLNAHFKRHTGFSFKCPLCGKPLMTSLSLKNHLMIHSGQKPHLCTVCGKQFRYGNRLTDHMRIHTGEKPYKCEICGKTFTQKSTLNDHFSIHEDRSVLCSLCGKSFKYRTALYGHMKTVHGKTLHSGGSGT